LVWLFPATAVDVLAWPGPATGPESQGGTRRHLSITGLWESGRGDLAERHDEIIRGRLKRPA
jgi:hypothetical protein